MGVMGMFLFIPLVSVLYAYLRSLVIRKLKYKKIDIDDKEVSDDVVPLMDSRRRMFTPKKNKQNSENQEDTSVPKEEENLPTNEDN